MSDKKAKGDVKKGEAVFNAQCKACHLIDKNNTGPALAGIVGNGIAANSSFGYSSALSSKSSMKWTDANLDKWLTKPSKFAPGTSMAYGGVDSKKDRADLIAYLKSV